MSGAGVPGTPLPGASPPGASQGGQLSMGIPQANQPSYGPGQGPNALQMMGIQQPSTGPYPNGFSANGPMGYGPYPGGYNANPGSPLAGPMPPRQAPGGPMPPMGPPMIDPTNSGGFFGHPNHGGMPPPRYRQ